MPFCRGSAEFCKSESIYVGRIALELKYTAKTKSVSSC